MDSEVQNGDLASRILRKSTDVLLHMVPATSDQGPHLDYLRKHGILKSIPEQHSLHFQGVIPSWQVQLYSVSIMVDISHGPAAGRVSSPSNTHSQGV